MGLYNIINLTSSSQSIKILNHQIAYAVHPPFIQKLNTSELYTSYYAACGQ